MKVSDCVKAFPILREAKLTKMEDKEKLTVIKALRAIGKVAKEYEELVKEIREKIKDERFADMTRRVEKFNDSHMENQPLTADEQKEVKELNDYFKSYNNRLDEVLKGEFEKEVEAQHERLTEEAFGRFLSSNDLTVDQLLACETVLI